MPNSQVADETSEYVTPAEAERIAFLSAKQISRLADAGRIAFIRPGKHRRYLRADVMALVAPRPAVAS
jgi:excisionase family DNA binding protein